MKRAVVVHGWGGFPSEGWFPWLKRELEEKGYEVFIPEMPETESPEIEKWVDKLKEVVGEVRERDIFIGYSIGCQTILRFLEKIKSEKKVDKVILVAGWFTLTGLGEEERRIAKPWVEEKIDLGRVKRKANKFVAIFSNNDPYVVYEENSKIYKERLGANIILEKGMGHFTKEDGVKELPEILNFI